MMHDDKRQESRFQVEALVAVLDFATLRPQGGLPLLCPVQDLSANGLQVVVDEAVIPGTVLNVRVYREGQSCSLCCEVMWCAAQGEGEYACGLRIYDAEASDVVHWKQFVARWLAAYHTGDTL